MTTIIIIVVVALVFFVALCVVTFMVWKHEEEMRTDSLQSIEENLQELGYRMTGDFSRGHRRRFSSRIADSDDGYDMLKNQKGSNKYFDPFGWTRQGEFQSRNDEFEYDESTMETMDELNRHSDVTANNGTSEEAEPVQEMTEHIDTASESQLNDVEPEAYDENDIASEEPYDDAFDGESYDDLNGYVETAEILRHVSESQTQLGEEVLHEEYEPDDENETPYLQSVDDMLIDDSDFVDIDQEANDDNNDYPEIQLDDLFAIDENSDNFDVIDIDDINRNDIDDYVADYAADEIAAAREPIGYDVGRSGKKYTAEELDMLIN